ncbi:MAG: RIP metalloprotease RseP [Acidobacteria bacterium 13_1_20CM_4_56_7]|nr:MAG: RIP metalloprotease RseP [Acidobacteria bacterium 13_1_20CM_4_56_7]PYV49584.1 MAG: RIP metalloprotease RseP [Acidobacteriota bacterium]
MNSFFISLFYFVIVIGFMVLIHEFGHYAVAKSLGVRVEQFAIGFGKRLFGFRRGETDYRINALPFGGYVKMSGENPMDERTGDPREFMSHSRWHRFLIAIAGPVMNILLAIVLLTGVYMVHYEHAAYLDQAAVVGWVEHGSPAEKQGIKPGDRIVQIDGVQNPTWEQVQIKQLLSANQPLSFTIQRDNQDIKGSVVPVSVTDAGAGSAGWTPYEPVIIGDLEHGMPAAKAGLKSGDKIISMDGKPVPSIQAMIDRLQQSKNKPLQLSIERGAQNLTLTVTPVLADTPGVPEQHYRLGFRNSSETKVTKLPLSEAFSHSLADNKRYSVILLQLVGKLVQRKASPKMFSGPIGIAQQTGEAAQEKGWTPLLALCAAISLNLGIFNLLPIPIMDGGVILLLFIESLMRRDISLQIKERIYQAAFVFLILFAAMVIYNDIAKTIAQRLP